MRPATFPHYLFEREITDDPEGAFVDDARKRPPLPDRPKWKELSEIVLEWNLPHQGVLTAARSVFLDFEKSMKSAACYTAQRKDTPEDRLDLTSVGALARQLAAGGRFDPTNSEGDQLVVVLRVDLDDVYNDPACWASFAEQHSFRAVAVRQLGEFSCRIIFPLATPLTQAKARKLGHRLAERFGAESFGTEPVIAVTLDVEPDSEIDWCDDNECDWADNTLAREDAERDAASGAAGNVEPKIGERRHPLEVLNDVHAVVHVKGVATILTEYDGGISLTDEKRLHPRYANNLRTKDGKKWVPISMLWIPWKDRRTYPGGLGFWPDPSRATEGSYNLWSGWAVEPDPAASCALFLWHLREIACHGVEATYQWAIGYLAHMVQRPGEKPRSAWVLKGRKGAGKDTLVNYIGRLLPRSAYLNTSDMNLMVGTFNGTIANKLLLHLEEGFWSGDRETDSRLKNLITAQTVTINEKFQTPYEVDSCHRLMITSNEGRVVNATEGERRYFITELDPRKAKDRAYFDALHAEMNGGGPAALMHLLRGFDLSGWHFEPPLTATLREHILDGLRGVAAWWYGVLRDGDLPGDGVALGDDEPTWEHGPRTVSLARLYLSYLEWVRGRRFEGDALNDGTFARELRKLCGTSLTVNRQQREGVRERACVFAPLAECREAFQRVNGTGDWES